MGKLPQRTWQWVDFSPRLPEYLSKADAGPPQVTSLITADSSGSALPLNSSNKVVSGSRYLETVTSIRCSFTSPNSLKSFLCLHWLLESTRKITSLQLHVTSDVQPRRDKRGHSARGNPCIPPASVEQHISHRLAETLLKPLPEGSYRS